MTRRPPRECIGAMQRCVGGGEGGGGLTVRRICRWALEAYGEYVQEAKDEPGSHPNIDLLLEVGTRSRPDFGVGD